MDNIILKNMAFQGKHGVLEVERLKNQLFIVSLELSVDLEKAAKTDHLEDTIDYSAVYQSTKLCVEGKSYHLLEALAGNILSTLFSTFEGIKHINIKLEKPNAPIDGTFDSVGVILSKVRK